MIHKILKENKKKLGEISQWNIEIVATDKNLYVLRAAEEGVYPKSKIAEKQRALEPYGYSLKEYFVPVSGWSALGKCRIKDEIKRFVVFEYLDLEDALQIQRMGEFDIIF